MQTRQVEGLTKRKRDGTPYARRGEVEAALASLVNLSREEILELNIPTGIPLLFELNDDLTVQSFRYLGDPEAARKAAEAVANQGKAK